MVRPVDLLAGIVVQTRTPTILGDLFYSDRIFLAHAYDEGGLDHAKPIYRSETVLNSWAKIPILGRLAGITRMALAVIHTVGHLLCAVFTLSKGHCFHAAKGACEFLRGAIETIPIVGLFFADIYSETGLWWMIKIYNPAQPDTLDREMGLWQGFRQARQTGYVFA